MAFRDCECIASAVHNYLPYRHGACRSIRSLNAQGEIERLLVKPLFDGTLPHDYARHQNGLEPIFTQLFPNWRRSSAGREVFPRVKNSQSVLYN
jgi:hypothetical protein